MSIMEVQMFIAALIFAALGILGLILVMISKPKSFEPETTLFVDKSGETVLRDNADLDRF